MCGIIGIISKKKSFDFKAIQSALKEIRRRGPDDEGYWISQNKKIIFGHTRLSIIDLSKNGSQPMISSSGRYTISFNGEIYNYKNLRIQLDNINSNIKWKSKSDTEVLLELFERFGIRKTLEKIDGMFAFGVYDSFKNKIYIVRDRAGEKPLYYGVINEDFVFASDLKSIKKIKGFDKKISQNAVKKFFQYTYIPSPLTIYENIYKLQNGGLIEIDLDSEKNINFFNKNIHDNKCLKSEIWWSHEEFYQKKLKHYDHNEIDIISNLELEIEKSIISQMYADVPMGCFLSGGIDSSIVACLMQKNSEKKIETFTVGFEDGLFDESKYAKKIANHISTNHNELLINNDELIASLELMPEIYSEPFADSSQIPTFLLSKFAKKKVKVCLTGDGADELFGGYNRYILSKKYISLIKILPLSIKKKISKLLTIAPGYFWNYLESLSNIINFKVTNLEQKINKISNKISNISDEKSFYFSMVSHFSDDNILLNSDKSFTSEYNFKLKGINQIEEMMLQDKLTYLPDDILCKVDRASMFNSLETRAPFLGKGLLEASCHIDIKYKIRNNRGKYLLRKILNKYVPKKMFDRPKMGFGFPLDDWIRNKFKKNINEYLNNTDIKNQGYLNCDVVERIKNEHFNNKNNHGTKLWTILMFQIWMSKNF